ncbi:trigger factor [Brumimicrobium glaciale]|uniref:Trigger factor n=1 Tax=Brumimicrobium glaciale TaxID=200475 RepID=A0A4Q4KL43_9FLAO|nr:trigger factor [Brumimicrobium glaciale]RYM33064.1 trigger factor [Brumimicrobium glaciale]
MNIIKENVDDLNALLKVTVEKSDYQVKVDKALSDYRKKATTPGFRKGMVPMGIIKKQHGRTVLGDELNRLVSEGLYKYVAEQEFEILGNPLPKNDIEVQGDFDKPDTFVFTYEIGISPKVDVKITGKNNYEYTKVKVDKKLIDKQLEDLTRRYGKLISGKEIGEKDMVLGQFVELNEEGEILEGGIMNSSTISMEFIEDEQLKKEMIGKKAGDKVTVNPFSVSRGGKDTASMLGIEESELGNISEKFQLTINEVKIMEPAELNQELFDKLFGEGEVTSEKQMIEKVKADLVQMFEKDSEKILTRRISNDLIEKADIQLPEGFLKRWIIASQKEPTTMEQVDADFGNYARSLKWQLIQNSIFKNNDMKVDQEEAMNYTKSLLVNQYAQYGMPTPEDAELTKSAQQVLSNQKEAQQIYDMLAEEKLTKFFKETVKLDEKEVDYDEYVKIAQDSNA